MADDVDEFRVLMDYEYNQWIQEYVTDLMKPSDKKKGYALALNAANEMLAEEIDAQPSSTAQNPAHEPVS